VIELLMMGTGNSSGKSDVEMARLMQKLQLIKSDVLAHRNNLFKVVNHSVRSLQEMIESDKAEFCIGLPTVCAVIKLFSCTPWSIPRRFFSSKESFIQTSLKFYDEAGNSLYFENMSLNNTVRLNAHSQASRGICTRVQGMFSLPQPDGTFCGKTNITLQNYCAAGVSVKVLISRGLFESEITTSGRSGVSKHKNGRPTTVTVIDESAEGEEATTSHVWQEQFDLLWKECAIANTIEFSFDAVILDSTKYYASKALRDSFSTGQLVVPDCTWIELGYEDAQGSYWQACTFRLVGGKG